MADGAESWTGELPQELVRKFAAARRRVRKVIFAKGWTLVILAACVCFGVSILLDRLLFLKSSYRLVLFAACVGAMASFIVGCLLVPLLRKISARRIARSVEDKHPELEDLLLSAVELTQQVARGETYTSKELIGAVSRETVRKTRKIDFRSVVPFSALGKSLLITLGVVCVLGAYCYLRPMIAANVLRRLLYPYSGPEPLTFTELKVLPGNVLVATGTDIEIKAIAKGKVPEKAILYLNKKGARWDKVSLPREKGREFRYALKGLLNPLLYKVRAGDARSETFAISVSDRPVIVGIEVAYRYPEYTGRAAETKSSDGGDIVAVKGSKVKITARANKRLKRAKLKFGDETESLVFIRGSVVQSQEFDVNEDESYSFDLLDTDGFSSAEAITHRIRALEDKAPEVGIRRPDTYSHARPDEIVPVTFRAVDDFGIEKVWLEYTVKSGEPSDLGFGISDFRIPIPQSAIRNLQSALEGEYALSLPDLKVKEGEIVVFRIVAEDNNVLSGPSKGSSSDHTIRIISDQTSFRKIEQEQQDLTRRLLRLVKQQKENRGLVEKLREALAAAASLSESEKSDMEQAKSVQRRIEEAGRQLSEDFAAMLKKMRLNPMIRPRTIIEMAEVTEALTRLSRNEMPEATQKATEATRSKERSERQRKLAETSGLQKKIIEALEELSKGFSQLQEKQRVLSLAEAASRLAEEQLAARAQTGAALPELAGLFPEKLTEKQKRGLKKLVDAQEKLKEGLSAFEERLRRLLKRSEQANSANSQMLASALKFFEQGNGASSASIPRDVNGAIEALRANHLHKGMNFQSQVYESLLKMSKEFQKAQMAMLQGEFSNTAQALELQESEIDKLIEIQKAVIAETERLPRQTGGEGVQWAERGKFEKVSQSQKDLLRRTSNYRAILEEVFGNLVLMGIDPVAPLKGAEQAMGKASGNLEKLTAAEALTEERNSLKNLEKARDELAKALAKMMSSANLQQAMQAMSAVEKMIQKQKKVNEGTSALDKKASGNKAMSDPMLEALRQLANQQVALSNTALSMKDYLKAMVKTGEMMGQSAKRLKAKQTGQQTQQLQSQILELLAQMLVKLQAQANAAAQTMGLPGTSGTGAHGGTVTEPILGPGPGGLDDQWAKLPPRMKQELLEAWTEKFAPEFRELIALYYKRLSGEEVPR